MKFLNNKREPRSAEDSAFAERLSAIASRSKGDMQREPVPELAVVIPGIERRFWNPDDLPEGRDEPAAA